MRRRETDEQRKARLLWKASLDAGAPADLEVCKCSNKRTDHFGGEGVCFVCPCEEFKLDNAEGKTGHLISWAQGDDDMVFVDE